MNIDSRQLQAFAEVAELGSFERAARRLHLTPSAISQRIKQLEERLGQLLIVRAQPLRLTPAGQRLLAYQHQLQLLQAELLGELGRAAGEGMTTLAIGLNADSLATWFLEALAPLLREASLLLDLRVSDQDQTHGFLRRGEVVGCISASGQALQGCCCLPLGSMHYRALASADFRRRHFSEGVTPASLGRAPAVEFDRQDALQQRYLQRQFGVDSGDYPRHRVPSPEAFLEMVRRGFGWGMVPDLQGAPLCATGKLCELTPGVVLPVPLYWHGLNLGSQTIKRLAACLTSYCQQHLQPISSAHLLEG